jgi:hypothetical protein
MLKNLSSIFVEIPISKVTTEQLMAALYNRLDDNLWAIEPSYEPYLDGISKGKKEYLAYALIDALRSRNREET